METFYVLIVAWLLNGEVDATAVTTTALTLEQCVALSERIAPDIDKAAADKKTSGHTIYCVPIHVRP